MNKEHAYVNMGQVLPHNIAFYAQYGYLIASNLLTANEIGTLKKETTAIFKGERGQIEGLLPVADNESDEDVLKKYVAIHFPHKISKVIHDSLFQPRIIEILQATILLF